MNCCIYCRKSGSAPSEEHIIPRGLIGVEDVEENFEGQDTPRRFVLENGEVCRDCNGAVGILDECLQREVGVLKVYWNSVGTKRGTPATVERPGLYAIRRPDGPAVFINTENHTVITEDGVAIRPPSRNARGVTTGEMEFDGEKPRALSFSQPIFVSKKFIRAVYKIAFETLCFRRGAEKVLDPRYDGIRQFILRGKGSRLVGVPRQLSAIPSNEIIGVPKVELQRIRHSFDYMSKVRLGVTFHVDLTPDHSVTWGPEVLSISEKHKLTLYVRSRMEFPLDPTSRSA